MGINKELLKSLFNDKFINEFNNSRDYQTRVTNTIIASVLINMMNTPQVERTEEFLNQSFNRILHLCCQGMKMSDIYVNLSRVYNNTETEYKIIDLKQLLGEFSEECNLCLNGEFTRCIPGKVVCIETCEEILLCLMLLYVRRVVAEGAKKINISYCSDEKKAEILFEITEKGEPVAAGSAEKLSIDYAYDLINIFAEKLECTAEVSEIGLKLQFMLKNDGNISFQCSEPNEKKKIFSLYHDFLSDMGDITLI